MGSVGLDRATNGLKDILAAGGCAVEPPTLPRPATHQRPWRAQLIDRAWALARWRTAKGVDLLAHLCDRRGTLLVSPAPAESSAAVPGRPAGWQDRLGPAGGPRARTCQIAGAGRAGQHPGEYVDRASRRAGDGADQAPPPPNRAEQPNRRTQTTGSRGCLQMAGDRSSGPVLHGPRFITPLPAKRQRRSLSWAI